MTRYITRTAPTEIPDWYMHAPCKGQNELFFPEAGTVGRPQQEAVERAKSICKRCPMITDCLELALSVPGTQDYGIWGGTTAEERNRERRKRRAA